MNIELVNIAEFKRHMGAFMRRVRRGERIGLRDRDTPVAYVTPYVRNEAEDLLIRPAKSSSDLPRIRRVVVSGARAKQRDSLTALAEERGEH